MMFAILFGLSMDYEVFLISRIREEYLQDGDTRRAVADGLAKTARVITAAAAIMVVVFLAFLSSSDTFLKLFGIGLASAIFLDATVVRMVLVPAVMQLLGKRNWWIPGLAGAVPAAARRRACRDGRRGEPLLVRGRLEGSAQSSPEPDAGLLQVAVHRGTVTPSCSAVSRADSPNTSRSTKASCCRRGSSPTARITLSIDWRRSRRSSGSTRSAESPSPPSSGRRLIWSSEAFVAIR